MANRFVVFDGPPSDASHPTSSASTSTPSAGGPVDGTDGKRGIGGLNSRIPERLDTGGSFSSGDDLATDGSGRAVAAGTGDHVVARALEGSSGAGDTAWVVKAGSRIA